MDRLRSSAYGKLNLMLDITGRREDGYHTLETVMQTVSLRDTVEIRFKKGGGIVLRCDLPYVPSDSRNIAWKAADAFLKAANLTRSMEIDIRKTIPVGGGMGGGSTDAAAVLRMLNRMFGFPLTLEQLDAVALTLGADVPFCLRRGTYLAEGVGEVLTEAPAMTDCQIVLCKPRVSVSSKSAFGLYDEYEPKTHPDARAMLDALAFGDLDRIAASLGNSFEPPIAAANPEIAAVRSRLLELGALNAAMTGSGSVVFGLYGDASAAHRAKDVLRQVGWRAYCVHPVGSGR